MRRLLISVKAHLGNPSLTIFRPRKSALKEFEMAPLLLQDILGWDALNWSVCLRVWEPIISTSNGPLDCLEIGCGPGGLSLWLASKGHNVVCSDLKGTGRRSEIFIGRMTSGRYLRSDRRHGHPARRSVRHRALQIRPRWHLGSLWDGGPETGDSGDAQGVEAGREAPFRRKPISHKVTYVM